MSSVDTPVVMKDAISNGELLVGTWLCLHDGTRGANQASFYRLVDFDTASNTAVLMGGIVKTDVVYRELAESNYTYRNSVLDNYLTTTFYNSIPDEYKRILVNRSIRYTAIKAEAYGGTDPVIQEIDRSVFAPSSSELGFIKSDDSYLTEGATFKLFSGNVDVATMRKADGPNSTISSWYWTRTRHRDKDVHSAQCVNTSGAVTSSTKWTARGVRPCINITMNCIVHYNGTDWWITPDLPPVFSPGSASQGNTFNDTDYTFTWNAGTDANDPSTYANAIPKYTPGAGGNVWYQIRERVTDEHGYVREETSGIQQSTSLTKNYPYIEKAIRADYAIRALDKWGNYTDWFDYHTVFITNNAPPNKPGNITYSGRYKGERISITWAPGFDANGRLDPDNNLRGYRVYRSVDGGQSNLIDIVVDEHYTDMSVGQWNTVTYSISAVDEYDAESEKVSVTISLISRVSMSLAVSGNSEIECTTTEVDAPSVETVRPNFDLSEPDLPASYGGDTGHSITFTLTDSVENHTYSGLISFRDAAQNGIRLSYPIENLELASGSADITFSISKDEWQRIPNGTYAIRCEVHDNDNSDNAIQLDVYFKKVCYFIYWEMSGDDAVVVEGEQNIDSYFLNVEMSDAAKNYATVEVTRNANDSDPDWYSAVYNTRDYEMFDSGQAEGNAFGVRVFIDRYDLDDGEEYYLSSVNGVFGMNMFEKIAAQIAAVNARIDDYHPES